MRVVVNYPARTEDDGTEVPASKAAYRVGRIEDYTDLLTGQMTPKEQVAQTLADAAKRDFPDLEVEIEYLHPAEGDEHGPTHEWKSHPPEGVVAPGADHSKELSTEQTQEVSS